MKATKIKALAADILNVGVSRIKLGEFDASEITTRDDVRGLIKEKKITVIPPAVPGKKPKKKRSTSGNRKGAKKARTQPKKQWMRRIRALRRVLKEARKKGVVKGKEYRKLYLAAKGNQFKGKRHLQRVLEGYNA